MQSDSIDSIVYSEIVCVRWSHSCDRDLLSYPFYGLVLRRCPYTKNVVVHIEYSCTRNMLGQSEPVRVPTTCSRALKNCSCAWKQLTLKIPPFGMSEKIYFATLHLFHHRPKNVKKMFWPPGPLQTSLEANKS